MKSFARFVSGLFLLGLLIGAALGAPILDPTFGAQGIERIGVPAGFEDRVYASALQPDGKLVVAGSSNGRQSYAFITRFTVTGTLDPTFGNAGVVLLPQPSFLQMRPATIDLLPGGNLLVTSTLQSQAFALTRLTAQGAVDTTFGNGGSVIVPESNLHIEETSAALRVAIQADGKLLVVTDATVGRTFALQFRRFLPDGAVDASFGTGGVRLLGNLPPDFLFRSGRLAVAEPNGGFTIVAGTAVGFTYLAVRVTPAGELDPSFGGVGYVSGYDIGNPADIPTSLARGNDGRYALFGYFNPPNSNAPVQDVLWKIDASGTRSMFGPDNRVLTGASTRAAGATTVLPDGAVALVYAVAMSASIEPALRFAVYEPNGNLRASFGSGGGVTVPVVGYVGTVPIDLRADAAGRLFAVGHAYARSLPFSLISIPNGFDALLASVSAAGIARTDFGRGDGTAIWNNPAFSNDRIDVLDVDASGGIETAGFSDSSFVAGSSAHMFTRLTSAGAMEPTFGDKGRAAQRFPLARSGVLRAVRQPNGATVVATGSSLGSSGSFRSVIFYRVNDDGTLDTTFKPPAVNAGGGGTVGLGVRPDGRIIYATQDEPLITGAVGSYVLQQFLPDGSVDPSFGNNGRASFAAEQNVPLLSDLALLADGSTVFAMFAGSKVHVFKADSSGAPVSTFGTSGKASFDAVDITYTPATNARLLALADGTLVTVGAASVSPTSGTVQRFIQIVRFSATGKVISSRRLSVDSSTNVMSAVALPDSSVIVARTVAPSMGTLARLLPDDQFDQGFGGENGYVVGFTTISALAVDASGDLLVAGQDATSALVARYRLDASATSVVAVEFFNVNLRHYFVTANVAEQASIDAGAAGPGWQRTGNNFRVWVPEVGAPVGTLPVCRFYGTPGRGPNSHFYTVSPAECAAVKRDRGWTYEGVAFYVFAPEKGQCEAGEQAVYRAYNNGYVNNDSNHRYSTQLSLLQAMTAQGWSVEGVAFCGAGN